MNTFLKRAAAVVGGIAILFAGAATANAACDANSGKTFTTEELAQPQSLTVTPTTGVTIPSNADLEAFPLATYTSGTYATAGTNKYITSYDVKTTPGWESDIAAAGNAVYPKAAGATSDKVNSSNPMTDLVGLLDSSSTSPWGGKIRQFLDKLKASSDWDTKVTNATGTKLTADSGKN